MQLVVNGQIREVASELTLRDLVVELALGPSKIAVELNGQVVPSSSWESTDLNEGDRVEIVHFVGGG